jgi:small basic protein (TIGR04137 family)
MSLDRSLKSKSALVRSRSVLTRAERLIALKDQERWEEGSSVFGLPKVAQRRSSVGSKKAPAAAKAETTEEKPAAE